MTQQELVKAIQKELRKSISQSYLSQIEKGTRPHMTQSSRALLAKFFKFIRLSGGYPEATTRS